MATPERDEADVALDALRAHLAARCRELDDEVRHYPTPIARCDVQLTQLLEQRSRAWRHATLAGDARLAGAAQGEHGWLARSEDAADDDAENALRAALRAALRGQAGGP